MPLKGTKRQRRRRPAPEPKTELCFAIMPFGAWSNDYYSSIFCPAIESAGLIPCRADDLYRPSTIVHDIWDYTRRARLILADLTGKNPNVFYELGLAHAIAKPAILVAESIDDVPFDLRALRVIEYNKNAPNWGSLLGQKITTAIREVLKSPLEAVLPAFLTVKGPAPPVVSAHDRDILELRREIDLLRRALRPGAPMSMERLTAEEAEALIGTFVNHRVPEDVIVRRLAERGVPEAWVELQLNRRSAARDGDSLGTFVPNTDV
jgi:hypothetical protein